MLIVVGATDDWRRASSRIGDGEGVSQALAHIGHWSGMSRGREWVEQSSTHCGSQCRGASNDKAIKVQSQLE